RYYRNRRYACFMHGERAESARDSEAGDNGTDDTALPSWATAYPFLKQSELARFSEKVQRIPGGCWVWIGSKNERGYGRFSFRRRPFTGKTQYAHRVSYFGANGTLGHAGIVICHSCDNPSCVNPDHLEAGTQSYNMQGAVERGRCDAVRGSANAKSKPTEEAVEEIRRRYQRGTPGRGAMTLAREYGEDRSLITRIVNGERWRHV